ncbi:pickpocket protein 19-like [Bactrocera neohumeralis]|uniref:pickpocket protein 19-like n=1 Tax=Bactrocera neohumeralis TaxID=98809 RepID=UPI0021655756|nr:pickpocket protein 19-like [Bactrocera neohumeralis]
MSLLEANMKPPLNRDTKKDIYIVKVKEMSEKSCSKIEKGNHSQYKNCQDIFQQELAAYGRETSVHGLKRILSNGTGRVERALWALCVASALSLLIYFSQYLANRFTQTIFKTTIYSTNHPIYKVPFPEVTICNKNRLNWARLEEVKQKFLWHAHHNTSYERLFVEIAAMHDTYSFGYFDRFANLTDKRITELNYINFTEVVRSMTWRCEELLTDCVWRMQAMNCCDIFIRRRSTLGICMAFNSIESSSGRLKQEVDSKWPWRVGTSGSKHGLQVRTLLNEDKHSPYSTTSKGITIMTVQPEVWSFTPIDIPKDVYARVYLDAFMSFFDPETRRVSSKKRRCVFKDEQDSPDFKTLNGHVYMYENCQAECQQEYLMKFCNCTVDIFFPIGAYPVCKLVDLPCLARHNHLVQYFQESSKETFTTNHPGMVCKCFYNCRSWRYNIKVRTRPLEQKERWKTNDTLLLDINFQRDFIIVYKTDIVYTWVDFLYNFGNITALFLGCSLVSLVELLYFFLVKVPQRRLCSRIDNGKPHKKLPYSRPALRSYRERSENNLNLYKNGFKKVSN